MSKRDEFSAKVKDQGHARSGGKCENRKCGALLVPGHIHYDHILPCALGGKGVLANLQVLCTPCHKTKTAKEDVPRIRKSDRQRHKHIGAKVANGPKIESPGFDKAPEQRKATKPLAKPSLPPRQLYGDVR
jgi:5-methylcytosine-specific restriction enzyme A